MRQPRSTNLSGLVLLFHALTFGAAESDGQEFSPEETLRVFVDCPSCDLDHFRRGVRFVDYVRDRADADVHVLITTQGTGADGTLYTLEYIGRGDFAGLDDELTYGSSPADTEAEERDGLTHLFQLGLVRYAARTPEATRLAVLYSPPALPAGADSAAAPSGASAAGREVSDPWNNWVFRVGAGGSFSAEQQQQFANAYGSLSISRVTEAWKISLRLRGNYFESQFEINDTTTIESVTEAYGVEGLLVRSVGDHWGVGLQQETESSTFFNYDLALRVGPAVEYNIFPYSQSTRRQFRILASVGFNSFNYIEETIFGKTSETLYDGRLNMSFDVTEIWGSALAGVEASQYLGQPGKNRLSFFASLDVSLFKGFGLNVSGDLSRIRDQVNLPAGEATPEEILLQQRELATDFQFSLSAGFTFTFGSIYSNVVNPRFGG
jgi:hypothetical protein